MYMGGTDSDAVDMLRFTGANQRLLRLRTSKRGHFYYGALTIGMLHARDGALMPFEILGLPILRYKEDDLSQVFMSLILSTSLSTFSFPNIRLKDEAIISRHLSS